MFILPIIIQFFNTEVATFGGSDPYSLLPSVNASGEQFHLFCLFWGQCQAGV